MKSNILNRLTVLTITLSFAFSCTSEKTGSQSDTFVKSITTKDQLKQEMDKSEGKLMLFDLYADWCGPCHVLAPVYNSLASVYKDRALFYRINVDKSPELAATFGVQSIPLVVFVKNSNAFYSLLGVHSKKQYIKIIDACDSTVSVEECLKSIGLAPNPSP
jgi:thioredoxin 1